LSAKLADFASAGNVPNPHPALIPGSQQLAIG
jgi:hypothetical protein